MQEGREARRPVVASGDGYSGLPIPDHETQPALDASEASGCRDPAGGVRDLRRRDASGLGRQRVTGGLPCQALVRVATGADGAAEAERVREVEQGSDGALRGLEEEGGARLLKLTPAG